MEGGYELYGWLDVNHASKKMSEVGFRYTYCFIIQFIHATYFNCIYIIIIISYL